MKHVRTLVALLETVRPLSEGGAQPLEADISVGIIIKLLSVETNLERNSWVGPLPTSSSRCSGSDIAHIHHRTCGASGNLELRSLSPLCMYTWRRKSFYRRLQSVPSAFFFLATCPGYWTTGVGCRAAHEVTLLWPFHTTMLRQRPDGTCTSTGAIC